MSWSASQKRALEAMGYRLWTVRGAASVADPRRLDELPLPERLRAGLERWMGPAWREWPAPPGGPADAGFKRALWRRIRDWRRGS